MCRLPIAETFVSLQGEGSRLGSPSFFIRAAGCNLRCVWCDTPYASWNPVGESREIVDLLEEAVQSGCTDIVLTGGEPMIFDAIEPLAAGLNRLGKHITIETAGTVFRELECDLISISPKLANSAPPAGTPNNWHARHDKLRLQPEVLQRLISRYDYQLKFVVCPENGERDLNEILEILALLPEVDRGKVYLMPEGTDAEVLRERQKALVPICLQHGLRLAPRLQIELFGNRRGT